MRLPAWAGDHRMILSGSSLILTEVQFARYDKSATSYEAAVGLASFPLWARSV